MLRVVSGANCRLNRDLVEQHYRLRHRIYVEERGWLALARPDGRERDQFDTDDAVYLLAVEGSRVVGGSRLVPTAGPHLMADVFPDLANVKGLQRGGGIFEWTRYFVAPDRRESGRSCDVSGALAAGVMEFGLAAGIRRLTVVFETYWLTRFLEYGWSIEPLGLPRLIYGQWTIGVAIDVTPEALAGVCAARGIRGSVLEADCRSAEKLLTRRKADHGTAASQRLRGEA